MARGLEFSILGPVEVRFEDRPIDVAATSLRALLARLLLGTSRVVSREQLMADLWVAPPSTGASALHQRLAQLRQVLDEGGAGKDVIQTRGTGYVIELEPGQLDLDRFEAAVARGDEALAADLPGDAVTAFRDGLALWCGPPLAEFPEAPFATAASARLEESRLAALEKRLQAELELGRHGDITGELAELAAQHPFREGFCAKLMLALYRAGRQAEALEAYQDTRRTLVEELGVAPTDELQELERAILQHEPSLGLRTKQDGRGVLPRSEPASLAGSVLVAPSEIANLPQLVAVGEPFARQPARELILAAIASTSAALARTSAALEAERVALLARGARARTAAFTSEFRGADMVRFATEQDADLLLTDAPSELLVDGSLPPDLEVLFRESPCHVAVAVAGGEGGVGREGADVVIPFGGSENDWAALDVGARFAVSVGASLSLLGSEQRPEQGKRDASRTLAAASLVAQRARGVAARPQLIGAGDDAILEASSNARLLVVGLSERWAEEGLGTVRLALAQGTRPAMLIVRSGGRSGGLTAQKDLTRYTWSRAQAP